MSKVRLRGRMAVLTAGAAVVAASLWSGTTASAATSDPYLGLSGTVTLSNDLLPGLGTLTPTGAVPSASTMSLGVMLARPDPAGENAYLASVYNPKSASFRQFLTQPAWQEQFGVGQSRYDTAIAWLHGQGLATTAVPGSTEYVLVSGAASLVEAAFHVQLDTYTVNALSVYANTAAPTVPADLGVLGISGLQDFTRMQTMQQIEKTASPSAAAADPCNGLVLPTGVNCGSTSPQDLWSIYDQPSNNRGQGESMAIFGWGCTEPPGSPYDDDPAANTSTCATTDLVSNLRGDESTYGLPQMPIVITHYGQAGDTISDASGTGEWTLDMPASTGMAPDAAFEHLYFGDNGMDPDILAAYNAWNSDPNAPRQGSSSFAGCEASPATGSQPGGPGNPGSGVIIGNPNQDLYKATLKETVELGHTMFNSAGDLGANGCPANTFTSLNGATPAQYALNNYPSSSTYVTTVGGTVLYWSGNGYGQVNPATRFSERAWEYTGGGTSLFIAAPSWQQDPAFDTNSTSAPGVHGLCPTNWEPNPTLYPADTLCRGLPDVAAQSGDILTNGYFAGGGTSLSSPLWLGMWARIQAASSNPGRLGFASPAIYANNASATNYEHDFFDIGGTVEAYNGNATNTETVTFCQPAAIPTYGCDGSGWDYLSGWGTPDVANLMRSLDNGNTAPAAYVAPVGVPEAPTSALLVLAGGAGVAVLAIRRRRRLTS